ncbi:hypothetical protein KKA15_06820 [Patescibacteria group bacterium]|nr:hypothetical protein [Patescibacteria group bacterium]
MKKISKKQFKTSNFYLSAFLICKGLKIVDVDRQNPRRALFVFEDSLKREELVREFEFGKTALVDVRIYASTLKELKNKLYS